MKNLYIDFDGVILDTYKYLYDFGPGKSIKDMTEDQITKYFRTYDWSKIKLDELVINDGINAIQRIIDSNKFNLAILTHINSLEEAEVKIKYLRKYFKDITIILCPKTISKTKMIHTKDAILVDDYDSNLVEWKKEHGIPIKFSVKKLSPEFGTINNLDKIIDMF